MGLGRSNEDLAFVSIYLCTAGHPARADVHYVWHSLTLRMIIHVFHCRQKRKARPLRSEDGILGRRARARVDTCIGVSTRALGALSKHMNEPLIIGLGTHAIDPS